MFPTNSAESREEQQKYLGKLVSLIDDANEQHICVIRDFNARPNTRFFNELSGMCCEWGLVIADTTMLPLGSFSHVNHGCLSPSPGWIMSCFPLVLKM